MTVPQEMLERKRAFEQFSRVECGSCEGGYSFDAWAQQAFHSEIRGEYNGWARKLGNLGIGESLSWTGAESQGTLTAVAEETVEGFRCRRLRYRLVRGGVSAERDGLVCWGRLNQYAGSDTWVEVY